MKPSNFLLGLTIMALAFTGAGCNDNGTNLGKIPFDERRAQQSVISIDTAKQYQQNFIGTRETLGRLIGDTNFLRQNFNLPNAESFTRDAIILLLNQTGADGIRLYYGKDNAGEVRLVILPIDKNGKDIQTVLIERGQTNAISIPGIQSAQANAPSQFQAIENGQTCPPCLID
ncbi:MAG: hypothetical protein ACXWCG_03540 [Flavitalea sp.]